MSFDHEPQSSSEKSELRSGGGNVRAELRQTAQEELDGLFRFAVARLGGKSDMAKDVVQQALLVAIAHAAPPDDAGRQRAWLRGIINNIIRREFRSRRRGRNAIHRLATTRKPELESVDPPLLPGENDGRGRQIQAIFHALTELDQRDQDLFYAYYRAGQSQAEIARELGTTTKGIETRLYRIRARLRKAVARNTEDVA